MLKAFSDLVREVAGHVRTVDAVGARTELEANEGVLIDVREPGEVEQRCARGAEPVPRGMLEVSLPERFPDPEQALYLHCAGGGRARLAAAQLEQLGYRRVTAIDASLEDIIEAFGHGD